MKKEHKNARMEFSLRDPALVQMQFRLGCVAVAVGSFLGFDTVFHFYEPIPPGFTVSEPFRLPLETIRMPAASSDPLCLPVLAMPPIHKDPDEFLKRSLFLMAVRDHFLKVASPCEVALEFVEAEFLAEIGILTLEDFRTHLLLRLQEMRDDKKEASLVGKITNSLHAVLPGASPLSRKRKAEILGITPQQVGNYENGKTPAPEGYFECSTENDFKRLADAIKLRRAAGRTMSCDAARMSALDRQGRPQGFEVEEPALLRALEAANQLSPEDFEKFYGILGELLKHDDEATVSRLCGPGTALGRECFKSGYTFYE